MSLDGKIATRSGDSRLSSNMDLERLHRMRSEVDAVMIGIGTLLQDNPRLTVRRAKGANPIRVTVDSLARTPLKSRILSGNGPTTIVAVSKRAPEVRLKRLKGRGAEVIRCGKRRVNLKELLEELWRHGIKRILLEGGGKLNWSMLEADLVDEIQVTLAPYVVGGERSTTLVDGVGVERMNHAFKLSLEKITRSGEEVVLNYTVQK